MSERDDRAGWQASLPPRWLNDSTYKGLSVHAWVLFTWTLAWGVGQENDGAVRSKDLPFIAAPMLNTAESLTAAAELVEAGLWDVAPDGFQVSDWEQSQPTSAEIEARRATWRRQKQPKSKTLPPQTPDENGLSSTAERGRNPDGKSGVHVRTNDKNGTNEKNERTSGPRFEDSEDVVVEATGEVAPQSRVEWPVVSIPGQETGSTVSENISPARCRVPGCGNKLVSPESQALGLCRKGDDAHAAARSVAA